MLANVLEISEEDLIYGPSASEKKVITKLKENTTVEKSVDIGAALGGFTLSIMQSGTMHNIIDRNYI